MENLQRSKTGRISAGMNKTDENSVSPVPLKVDMEKKIKFVSRIVLFIAIFGFLTYALFEFFLGIQQVFMAGLITCAALLLPTLLVFLNKVKAEEFMQAPSLVDLILKLSRFIFSKLDGVL